jgi:thiamine biosynthesis lipoprotein
MHAEQTAHLAAPAGATMGTTWSARLLLPPTVSADTARAVIQAALDRVVAQMSTWDSSSDICRYNRSAPSWQNLPDEFFLVLRRALNLAGQTKGAYDPTIGPLVRAWGFGPSGDGNGHISHPHADHLQTLLAQCGWQRVQLDSVNQRAWQPGAIELDLSSIAKGYGVDAAAQALEKLGLQDYLVEVGGELRTRGKRPDGEDWHIAIDSPQGQGHAVTLPLRDAAMATSGDYQRYFEAAGKRHAHTIDPRTGLTVDNGVASVTVVHANCMEADALATALLVLGLEAGNEWACKNDIAALFITRAARSFQLHATPAFRELQPRVAA